MDGPRDLARESERKQALAQARPKGAAAPRAAKTRVAMLAVAERHIGPGRERDLAGDGANGHLESPKAVPAAETRHSLSGRLRDAFQHDSAACSRRVVESRCENLAGREIFRGAA